MYIDKLTDVVHKCNITNYSTIKMKPVNVMWSRYFDFDKENNKEDPKFKVGSHVRILKYKKFLESVTFQSDLKKSL